MERLFHTFFQRAIVNGLLEKFLESCSKCTVMNGLFTSMQKAGLAGFHVAADREAGEDAGERRQHGKIF